MGLQAYKMLISKKSTPVLVSGLALFALGLHDSAHARPTRQREDSSQSTTRTSVITLNAGKGQLIQLSGPAQSVFSADPKVAEVRPASQNSIFIFGLTPGRTTVVATNQDGAEIGHYAVNIQPSAYPFSALSQTSARMANGLHASPSPDGLMIEGDSTNPEAAWQFTDRARGALGKEGFVSNYAKMRKSIQVNLKVRIVEMERSLVREIGVEWQNVNALGTSAVIGVATSSPLEALATTQSSIGFLSRFKAGGQHVTLETVVDMLARDGLVHSLAEPNLTTISGQPASFIVGGEYPVPISSYGNTTNVEFKQYGISLAFIPTVLDGGRISLHVKPEVSALSSAGAVTISAGNSTLQIPAITVRRADTTVEVASGQSFAIAGLMSDSTKITGQGLPWLSDIPVLGALFKSSSFQKDETELVIIATPYLVKPVNNESEIHSPDDGWTAPNDMERIFMMRQSGKDISQPRVRQHLETGAAGFMVE